MRACSGTGPPVADVVRPEERERIAVGGGKEGIEFGGFEEQVAQFHRERDL